jgi:TonB family protein
LVLAKIFLLPGETLSGIVPVPWREFICTQESSANAKDACSAIMNNPGAIAPTFKVGDGVSSPRPTYTPDPEYSEVARRAGLEVTCVIAALIGPSGVPVELRIVQPTGVELDEHALRAVSTWRFQPGQKDGKPVPVWINVEVSFRLY